MAFTRPGYNNNNNKNRNRNRNRRPGGGTGNSGGGGGNGANRVYDSNGPDVKLRGTAQTIAEKYMQLGRDAQSSGDIVMAESYYQFGDHYYRLWLAAQPAGQPLQFSRRMAEEDLEDEQGGEGSAEGEDDGQNQNGENAPSGEGNEAGLPAEGNGDAQPADGQQDGQYQRQNRPRDFNNNNNNRDGNNASGRNFRQRWPRRNDRNPNQQDGNGQNIMPVEGAPVEGQEPRQEFRPEPRQERFDRPERNERNERNDRPERTAVVEAAGDENWEAPSFLKRPAPVPESVDDVIVDEAPVAAAPRRRGRPAAVKPEDAPQGD
jgi:Domain of unknown function (DUF4167)